MATDKLDDIPPQIRAAIEAEQEVEAYRRHCEEESSLERWFEDVAAEALVAMWKSGRHWKTGKALSALEMQALAEQHVVRFGSWPHELYGEELAPASAHVPKPEPLEEVAKIADDTMLRLPDVLRITGLSERTIERMMKAGKFPQCVKLIPGKRPIGWRANEVKAWVRQLEDARFRHTH